MNWREFAACVDLSPEEILMFFGDEENEEQESYQQYRHVQRVCYQCPVQIECLRYALENDQKLGVWGGLTESQRKRYGRPTALKKGTDDITLVRLIDECGARVNIERSDPIEV